MDLMQREREAHREEIQYHRENTLKLQFLLDNSGKIKGEWVFIHPYKMYEILADVVVTNIIHHRIDDGKIRDYIEVKGQKYVQTPLVPPTRTVFANWRGPFLNVEFYEEWLNEERARKEKELV